MITLTALFINLLVSLPLRKSQRPDWRLERKINVETFGVSSARRGYYPRGRGGYYRGGYYRTYNYNHGYYR